MDPIYWIQAGSKVFERSQSIDKVLYKLCVCNFKWWWIRLFHGWTEEFVWIVCVDEWEIFFKIYSFISAECISKFTANYDSLLWFRLIVDKQNIGHQTIGDLKFVEKDCTIEVIGDVSSGHDVLLQWMWHSNWTPPLNFNKYRKTYQKQNEMAVLYLKTYRKIMVFSVRLHTVCDKLLYGKHWQWLMRVSSHTCIVVSPNQPFWFNRSVMLSQIEQVNIRILSATSCMRLRWTWW